MTADTTNLTAFAKALLRSSADYKKRSSRARTEARREYWRGVGNALYIAGDELQKVLLEDGFAVPNEKVGILGVSLP